LFSVRPAFACNVPVCDVAAELKNMASKNQNYRFQLLSRLRQENSKEKDEQRLNNLLFFARAAVTLIQNIGDEDYVLREAKSLRDQSVFLLVQWVWRDCQRLSSGYGELAAETQRYATLDFFLRRVEALKNDSELKELACFAEKAESISRTLEDADYVARAAVQLGAALATQRLEVINGWEGAFRLTQIDGPLADEADRLQLILFSSGGELGIVASLSHPDLRPVIFQKLAFSEGPHSLASRQSFASAVPSVLNLRFDEKFANITGTFLDPVEFKKIHFSARREISVHAFSDLPCSEDDLLGVHRMEAAGKAGRFAIERIGPRQLAAVFSADDSSIRLPFAFGRYNPATGRLTFLNMQVNVPLGWRLRAEKGKGGGCSIRGWGLSTFTGSVYPLMVETEPSG
jgi:hypothetical protein